MLKVIAALGGLEAWETRADRGPQHLIGAAPRFPENRFQLCKEQLDRIEVGTVFREKPEVGAGVFNRAADRRALVARQVVHDDDVPRRQRGDEHQLDIRTKAGAINRAVEDGRRREARHAERGKKRRRVPAPIGRLIRHPRPIQAPSIATDQIRADATFIEKDEASGIERRRGRVPGRPRERDVSAVVFGRAYRFF